MKLEPNVTYGTNHKKKKNLKAMADISYGIGS